MVEKFVILNTDEEYEYNNPKRRLKQHASIRIYEDDRIDELERDIKTCWKKLDIIIKMLTAMGYKIGRR